MPASTGGSAPPPSSNPPPTAPPPAGEGNWAKTTLWGVVLLFITLNVVFFVKTCREIPGRTLDQAGSALASIAAAFKQGTVTTSFVSYATTLTNHQRLQVATLREMAVFTQTNQMSTAFGYLPLPDVVVEARAPVEYTYYLDLNAPWQLVLEEGVIRVRAPRLQVNKPAVDLAGLTYEVRKGSFKTDEALEDLKRSIGSLVVLRGREGVSLIRESARRETAAFVEKWLMRSFHDAKAYPVQVTFEGEPGSPVGPVRRPESPR
ncbi:MAG: hypothetical protein RJA22_751 [Verrucomicrobiota bacterium]|jgi:hypothetical protein